MLKEDPRLTVKSEVLRSQTGRGGAFTKPSQVGYRHNGRDQAGFRILNAGPAGIVIFTTQQTSNVQVSFLKARGVHVYVHDSERVNLPDAFETLKELGIHRLMVEGGATLNFELLKLGLVDEVTAYVAPMIFGGDTAPTMAAGSGLSRSEAIPLKLSHVEHWDDGGVLLHYFLERSI